VAYFIFGLSTSKTEYRISHGVSTETTVPPPNANAWEIKDESNNE
jgi:hypothetical protein